MEQNLVTEPTMSAPLSLFEGIGIELEYMIVNRNSLEITPIADVLFRDENGNISSDYVNKNVTWSNELMLHVIELKTTNPASNLHGLDIDFHQNIKKINQLLSQYDCCLMPSAMHPLLTQESKLELWPHDNNVVYESYNRIFGCKGHGWSNVQSTHINLPFANDEEFGRLHAAIRYVLPMLPALTASSPLVEGRTTESLNNRLMFYQENQNMIPSIAGEIIPEPIYTIESYHRNILNRIYSDIAPYDSAKIFTEDWLNSRGAIPRFGRQSIEIRILDIQECPKADLLIASLIIETIKALVNEEFLSYEDQKAFPTSALKEVYLRTLTSGERATLSDHSYFNFFERTRSVSVQQLWLQIFSHHSRNRVWIDTDEGNLSALITSGTLSSRILRQLSGSFTKENIENTYQRLIDCLNRNALFQVNL